MVARLIRLRRPATLAVQEGVFVPPPRWPGMMDEIDRRWSELQKSNSAYFDGRLYHVLGAHRNGHGGCVLHVIDAAYRFFAVQDASFDVGIRPLGVKGIVKRGETYLMGLRSESVGVYPNLWEFAPGGSVEPGREPAEVIQRELREETGLISAREPTSLAVIFDPVLRCWELLFELQADSGEAQPRRAEYAQLAWRALHELPNELSPIARQIAALIGR